MFSGDKAVPQAPLMKVSLGSHSDEINAFILLSDNSLASAGADKTIKIWDVQKKEYVMTLEGHTNVVRKLAELPNGLLASASFDKTVKIWNIKRRQCVATLSHTHEVDGLAVLSNGRLVSGDWSGVIKFWDTQNYTCEATIQSGAVRGLIALPNGLLASAIVRRNGCFIKIWEIQRRTCVATLEGHTGEIGALVGWSNGLLISGSYDNTIKLWDKNYKCVATLVGHSGEGSLGYVKALAILSEDVLASADFGGTIKTWDLKKHKCIMTFNNPEVGSTTKALAVLPNKVLVAARRNKIELISNFTLKPENDLSSQIKGVQGREKEEPRKRAEFYNMHPGTGRKERMEELDRMREAREEGRIAEEAEKQKKKVKKLLRGRRITALAVLPNGLLASGNNNHAIKLWDIKTHQCVAAMMEPTGKDSLAHVKSLVASRDGFLASCDSFTIKIWDTKTYQYVGTIEPTESWPSEYFEALAISPDGLLMSTSYSSKEHHYTKTYLGFWNINTRQPAGKTIEDYAEPKTFVTLSNGLLAVACTIGAIDLPGYIDTRDGSRHTYGEKHEEYVIKLQNIKTGECLGTFNEHTKEIRALAVLENELLASGSDDGTIKLWDLKNQRCEATFSVKPGCRIGQVAALPGGSLVAGVEEEIDDKFSYTIKLWDVKKRRCRGVLQEFPHEVRAFAVLPDGGLAVAVEHGIKFIAGPLQTKEEQLKAEEKEQKERKRQKEKEERIRLKKAEKEKQKQEKVSNLTQSLEGLKQARLNQHLDTKTLDGKYKELESTAKKLESAYFYVERGEFYHHAAQEEKNGIRKHVFYTTALKDYNQALSYNAFFEKLPEKIKEIEEAIETEETKKMQGNQLSLASSGETRPPIQPTGFKLFDQTVKPPPQKRGGLTEEEKLKKIEEYKAKIRAEKAEKAEKRDKELEEQKSTTPSNRQPN